jgi:cellulose synthase (UDP-forming)
MDIGLGVVAGSLSFKTTSSRALLSTRLVLSLFAILALGVLAVLPLGWKEQATFGAALIALAVMLHVTSRSSTMTLALMAISVFATVRYGYWRAARTWEGMTSAGHLRQGDVIFVFLLLAAEFYAFATLILGYFQTARPLGRQPVPLPSDSSTWPTVDVFIPTYNESLQIVRATVLGALAMDYPAEKLKVTLLDDGRRDDFRDFATTIGVGYLTRENNVHAKAGNINHALERTQGEFIAIFDADHIPTADFLRLTLGPFLNDPRMGLVQTPHHFYSPDPFERNLERFRKIPNEGELFHRLVQDGNDLWNASFFCGSCAVLRRAALDAVGGIAVETVTEDAHTALRLHRAAWHTAFLNIPLAAGLATESLAAHIGQRIRWARGMVQILRLENPLFRRGLTVPQRLCYFNATTHFLFALPRLVFLTIPLVYLLLGRVNIYGYSLAVFAYAFPHIVLSHVATARSQRQYRFSFWNEIYEAVLAPYILLPTLLALINPRLGRFNVTAKGGIIDRSYFDHRIALPLLCLLALNVAGLLMGWHRYGTDPAHRDTVIMNVLWTIYNIVIISVATSVALERRQRRSEVRVDVQVPLTLITPDGDRVAGTTSELSRGGVTGHFDASLEFPVGSRVIVLFRDGDRRCDLTAWILGFEGRVGRLAFSPLDLRQEKYLLGLAFSRPEAWQSWQRSRPLDRPLRSGLEILGLAVRGLLLVISGPWARRSAPVGAAKRPTRRAAVVGSLVIVLGLYPTGIAAQQSATFEETYQLGAITGSPNGIALRGPRAVESVFFAVPVTKIIRAATLELRYGSLLAPSEATLELWLNGTRVADLPPAVGLDVRADVSLPADLLTTDNTLSFHLTGTCAACGIGPSPWITVSPVTVLRVSGSRLPLVNDLSLLPVPFLDPIGQRLSIVPVTFSDAPDTTSLQAAAIIASWFGVFADVRGVRFPVVVGDLPMGNAVVFARRGSALEAALALPAEPDALVALRDNPRDPYGKLLIITAANPEDLVRAARTLTTRDRLAARTDVVPAGQIGVAARPIYDAPRWLKADRPAPIGMYTSAERLKIKGAGSVNIYFRVPPDLFLSARQSVPLRLEFAYGSVSGKDAALYLRLNDQDVETVRLPAAAQPVQRAETVWLPTGRLRPYANTLTIDFDPGSNDAPTDVLPTVAIQRESSIDFRGLPHSVILPRLELFADAGYPFTAWADLGRTAVVIPEAPTRGEYEALLNIAGAFGGQTGSTATGIEVTTAARLDSVREKDLIVLGTPASQPLLRAWAGRVPLDLSAGGLRVNAARLPSRLLYPEWPFRSADRDRLAGFVANRPLVDTVVEQFVSPVARDRSVVLIVPRDANNYEEVPDLFMPAVRKGPVYGGVALARNGRFQSFLVGSLAYRSGDLHSYERAEVFLFEHYWLLPLFVFVPALIVALEARRVTERVAARRSVVPSVRQGWVS